MKSKRTFLLVVFITTFMANAQNSGQSLEGRVFSTSNDVSSVHVSNLNLNRGTITDASGFFSITVRLGDTLSFSAVQFKKKEVNCDQNRFGGFFVFGSFRRYADRT